MASIKIIGLFWSTFSTSLRSWREGSKRKNIYRSCRNPVSFPLPARESYNCLYFSSRVWKKLWVYVGSIAQSAQKITQTDRDTHHLSLKLWLEFISDTEWGFILTDEFTIITGENSSLRCHVVGFNPVHSVGVCILNSKIINWMNGSKILNKRRSACPYVKYNWKQL